MSNMITLLERNQAFSRRGEYKNVPRLPFLPHAGVYIITCVDPRTDPANFLELAFAEAIVARTVGGRVTDAVIRDLSYISYLVERIAPEGPYFEVAVVHHTDCGTRLLEQSDLRHAFAERSGYSEDVLAELAVTDPQETVKHDVRKLLNAPQISSMIVVSGYVYDTETGILRNIVAPQHPSHKA